MHDVQTFSNKACLQPASGFCGPCLSSLLEPASRAACGSRPDCTGPHVLRPDDRGGDDVRVMTPPMSERLA